MAHVQAGSFVAIASDLRLITVTIANNASLSGAVDLGGYAPIGIIMPSAWTTANLTFQTAADATNYANVYDMFGTEYTVVASTSRYIVLNPVDFAGIRGLKIRSGTSGSAVNQGGERTLTLVTRAL